VKTKQNDPCPKCGGTTRAKDGTCNGIMFRRMKRGGVPQFSAYVDQTEIEKKAEENDKKKRGL